MASLKKQDAALIKWGYTWNNYPEGQQLDWIPHELIAWHVCQYEVAPTTGTPHIQGLVHFLKRIRFTALRKQYPGLDWRPQQAKKDEDALAYHTKEESRKEGTEPFIYGAPQAGNPVPAIIIDMAKKRMYNEISEEYPVEFLRHGNFIKQIASLTETKPTNLTYSEDDLPPHIWFYGFPGSGKSTYCRNHYGSDDTYTLKAGQKWWPNYRGEKTVHIEDMDESHAGLLGDLKTWGDKFPFYIEDKGTGRTIRPDRILVSSNCTPMDIWPGKNNELHVKAISRRYQVICFTEAMRDTM